MKNLLLVVGLIAGMLMSQTAGICQQVDTKPANDTAKKKTIKTTAKTNKATKPKAKPGAEIKTAPLTTPTPPPTAASAKAEDEVHWMSIQEAEAKMREKPKKVIINFYTSWCGWCKRMDATTYSNPSLIKYVNNNFYAVRFDAESRESFMFNGKEYHFEPQYKCNTFAMELLKGQLGYPTTVFMMENFQNPNPIPGYQQVKDMEMFLLFFGDNICMHRQFEDYKKSFVSAWDKGNSQPMMPPPAH